LALDPNKGIKILATGRIFCKKHEIMNLKLKRSIFFSEKPFTQAAPVRILDIKYFILFLEKKKEVAKLLWVGGGRGPRFAC
jgi:hypothetical protein